MTLTQLRTFLAVAETVSVRAAAERLVVSQPSVSAAVASLERELGVALVARQGRGLRITPAGAAFAARVRQSLGLLDLAVRSAQSLEAPGQGTVHVVTVTTAAERLLPPLLAVFRQQHPDAGVDVQVGNRTMVWEALRDHSADLVIAGRPPVAAPVRVLATAPNQLVLIGPPISGGDVPVATLADQTWLMREAGSGTRDAADHLLADLGIAPPTMILGSNGAIEQAVAAGLGIALISLDAVADRIANGTMAIWPCPGTPLDRPWHLVAHASGALSPTAMLLAQSMTDVPDRFDLTPEGRVSLQG
ncbi:MAG: LysR family transcriptional regulator, low CO2-responsive transcriptional regulator [Acidimicrobiaceae bacterium]|nr:LysR family transcriptional regulator, low CO2-responsive transcriptional regulator [Acidimicrobiaceae bacterium]